MSEAASESPYLEAILADAVAPFVGRIPEAEIQAIRDEIKANLADDPALRQLYQAARPRTPPVRTGDAVQADPTSAPSELTDSRRRKGGAA